MTSTKSATQKLEELILPGTPSAVCKKYLELAERAEHESFDVLEDDIVVLDTETTGLSFKKCSLIEISAAKLSGREIVERFQTFVDPGCPIPEEITALTSITDEDVKGAPSAKEAVAALAEFVGGLPVLAHNATFDRTFIERVPGGTSVSDTWIDTLSLSRIALPRLSSHKLSSMAEAFGTMKVTHRASDDVDALCGMWRILLLGLMNLPRGLLAKLASMHDGVEWTFRPIFSYLSQMKEEEAVQRGVAKKDATGAELADAEISGTFFSLKDIRSQLVADIKAKARRDADDPETPAMLPISKDEIHRAFGKPGVVSQMYDKFETRNEQVSMSVEVRNALVTSSHRELEAGTGIGKSIAYLLPEVLFAQKNDVTVGIATKTNALTDQLVAHDLPALARALPNGLSFCSLKGYEHYPCMHRVDRAALEELPLTLLDQEGRSSNSVASDMLTAIAVIYAYACQSADGDLDALGIRWRSVPREMVTIKAAECLRSKCPYYPHECFVHGARKRAGSSDVVVTNHSLLLRNVAADGKILPPIRHWVIDEAHGFEAEARHQWAVEISAKEMRNGFELLGGIKSGAIHAAMVGAANLEDSTLLTGLLTRSAAAVQRAMAAMGNLMATVHELAPLAKSDGGYNSLQLWINDEVRETEEWKEVLETASIALSALEEATLRIGKTTEALIASAPNLASNLSEAGMFLNTLLESLKLICEGTDKSYVYSAKLTRLKRDIGSEALVAEKLDIGAELAEKWLPETHSVVFTSATIAVGDDFSHFEHAVGLDRGAFEHKSLHLESSFDYENHMAVFVAEDMPAPTDPGYLDALEKLLYDVHVQMGGSVLTLFTNRRDMERLYEALEPRLSEQGLNLACQERSSSARRVREKFLAEKNLSLFALKSFWEGFDAAGDTLRCVVIPKLPFASPNEPLVKEREAREDRAWWRYSLPEAVIATKQAAGRLIRSADDKGVLVLADSRLVSKRYGSSFLKSLPNKNYQRVCTKDISEQIAKWREEHDA